MISIGKVLSEVNNSPKPFSIEYAKLDGSYGKKEKVKVRGVLGNAIGDKRILNRSGLLRLEDLSNGRKFEVYIDLLVKYNGEKINFL